MLFKKHKEHLYDSKNFDKYDNVYVIKADKDKINQIIYDTQTNPEVLQHKYDRKNREIIISFLDAPQIILLIKSLYKIIFGHFYNTFNDFLFKKTNNKKVINTSVYRCNKELLLKNKEDDLIYTNSYNEIAEHRTEIINEKQSIIQKEFNKPEITFNKNTININSEKTNVLFNYNNKCINIHNKKIYNN